VEFARRVSVPRVLLTGGTGYLGSHLAHLLVSEGWEVTLLKRRTSKLGRISKIEGQLRLIDVESIDFDILFRESRFDLILHCATNYGRNQTNQLTLIEANLLLPLKLLLKAIEYEVPTFVNTDTILDKRIGDYSRSKKQFLEWMESVSSQIRCLNVSLEHFFGPGDDPSKFVSFIVESLVVHRVESIDLTPGEQYRDFIYIDDVVQAFAAIIKNSSQFPKGLKKFEVGSGIKIKLKDFVQQVKAVSGNNKTELKFGALPYRANELMETKVNLEDLLSLGWSPKTNLQEGILRTLKFHQKT